MRSPVELERKWLTSGLDAGTALSLFLHKSSVASISDSEPCSSLQPTQPEGLAHRAGILQTADLSVPGEEGLPPSLPWIGLGFEPAGAEEASDLGSCRDSTRLSLEVSCNSGGHSSDADSSGTQSPLLHDIFATANYSCVHLFSHGCRGPEAEVTVLCLWTCLRLCLLNWPVVSRTLLPAVRPKSPLLAGCWQGIWEPTGVAGRPCHPQPCRASDVASHFFQPCSCFAQLRPE